MDVVSGAPEDFITPDRTSHGDWRHALTLNTFRTFSAAFVSLRRYVTDDIS
jgi:hypothetical protein